MNGMMRWGGQHFWVRKLKKSHVNLTKTKMSVNLTTKHFPVLKIITRSHWDNTWTFQWYLMGHPRIHSTHVLLPYLNSFQVSVVLITDSKLKKIKENFCKMSFLIGLELETKKNILWNQRKCGNIWRTNQNLLNIHFVKIKQKWNVFICTIWL